jgi:hypothetical protein
MELDDIITALQECKKYKGNIRVDMNYLGYCLTYDDCKNANDLIEILVESED